MAAKAKGEKRSRSSASGEASDGKPDWKKMRVERKQLKESRKKKDMKPEIYQLSKEAKALWEELRKESCPGNVRTKLCNDLYHLLKGHIKRLSFAHDTARVLESLMLYGTEEIRESIHKAFSASEDFLCLIKSKYGHFLALKMMKYGSKEHREAMFRAMEPNILPLLKHLYASKVLTDFYTIHAKAAQREIIIKECYAPLLRMESVGDGLKDVLELIPDRRTSIMANLLELIELMLEKGMKSNSILHVLMFNYLENCAPSERAALIETMREEVVEILHTCEGARLGMCCLWRGSPKDRKVILKSFKGAVTKIACDKFGYAVLAAAIDVVDDVVLVSKAICTEFLNNLDKIAMNQYGQRCLSYLFEHRSPSFFDPEVSKTLSQGDNNEYTKKPIHQRIIDITEPLREEFLDGVTPSVGIWLKNNSACLLLGMILKRYSAEPLDGILEKLAETIAESSTEEGIERRPVEMLVKFILYELSEESRLCFSSALIENLSNLGVASNWVHTNRGSLTLLRIIEKCGNKSEPAQKVKRIVTENLSVFNNHESLGGKLLLEAVQQK